jgi:beta-xylosidase
LNRSRAPRGEAVGAILGALVACSSPGDSGDPADRVSDDASGGADGSTTDGAPPATLDGGGRESGADATTDAADAAPPPVTYTNPVLPHDFPDPFLLREGTAYYAFATNGAGRNVQAAKATALGAWVDLPDALPQLPVWAAKNQGLTWAPAVLKRGAAYVMYYTARHVASGFQCISRAIASAPEGPYVDTSTRPLICQVAGDEKYCGSIDPSPFVDANGAAYLLWKSDENAPACAAPPRLWSALLASDGLTLAGPAMEILAMSASWEKPIIEGPSMMEHAGIYFLFYSANAYESAAYAMGYATCLSPTGPCKKVTTDGPWVQSATTALGPGGGEAFVDARGSAWMAYHAWTAPRTTYPAGARSLRIDPLVFANGKPALKGPTTTPQIVP